jgi:hypothetical protein
MKVIAFFRLPVNLSGKGGFLSLSRGAGSAITTSGGVGGVGGLGGGAIGSLICCEDSCCGDMGVFFICNGVRVTVSGLCEVVSNWVKPRVSWGLSKGRCSSSPSDLGEAKFSSELEPLGALNRAFPLESCLSSCCGRCSWISARICSG